MMGTMLNEDALDQVAGGMAIQKELGADWAAKRDEFDRVWAEMGFSAGMGEKVERFGEWEAAGFKPASARDFLAKYRR